MNLLTDFLAKLRQKVFWKSAMIYMVFILLMCCLVADKSNYNVDELLSYALANSNAHEPWFEDGVTYTPAQSPWLFRVTVKEGGYAFNWGNVWESQATDVHPPFYYVLLHIICSLFQGKFSKWFAGSINIVFAVLTLYIVKKLVYELTDNPQMVSIVSVFFALCGGILSSIRFLRMYVMAMFMVSLVTYLFIYASGLAKLSARFYINLILISYIGALTHYYFIVYLFFLCLVFGIWLLVYKRYSETILFVLAMGLSGVLAVKTFPSMLQHMFMGSNRGVQSVENLKAPLSDYVNRLRSFYAFVNDRLFGGILTYIVLAIILFYFFSKQDIKEGDNITVNLGEETAVNYAKQGKGKTIKYLLMVIPSVCYFLIVSKMAVYITDRYLHPVYAVFMVWILCGIINWGGQSYKKGIKVLLSDYF